MNSLSKIRMILLEPHKFFSRLKEKTITDAFVMYAVILAISVILGTIIGLLLQDITSQFISNWLGFPLPQERAGALVQIGLMILGYLFGVIGSFVMAGVLHVWVMIFGGKEQYARTYQLYAYSKIPSLLLSWIPGIGLFAWIYTLALLIIGTQEIHKIPKRTAILMYLVPVAIFIVFILLLLLFFIHLAPDFMILIRQAAMQQ